MKEDQYEKLNQKEVNPLKIFLEKFKKIVNESEFYKDKIQEAIYLEIGIKLEKNLITITKGIVVLSVSPLIKNEVLIKKHKILKHLTIEGLNILDIK